MARRHVHLADGSLAPRRRGRKRQKPICRSCGQRFAASSEATAHRRAEHGPYTYQGFALRVEDGVWQVPTPDRVHSFDSREAARDFIAKRVGIRRSIHTVSGGLPTLGKRR